MKILICGATGFVGRHLTSSLREAGHTVIRAVRRPGEPGDIAVDFCNDTTREVWLPRLKGISVVINAVGLLRDSPGNPMQKLHAETPAAVFAAAAEANVERVIHLSALGVDSGIDTAYFSTRLLAEQVLATLPARLRWLCLRPSVIYGEDGTSAKMFRTQANLPVHGLPMGGRQRLQPVHIDDICSAVSHWLSDPNAASQIVEAVGAEATDMRGMLDSYRQQLGYGSALHISIPSLLVKMAARIGDHIPASPLCSDTLKMLSAGNTADAASFAKLLGRAPRSYREFIV
ncbi:NAD-dependent epimerase/dehydratase family protein [Acidithiobacillus sp.]|uniref:NAD-dependent epimerase/dehydratase family protein n=1 Tax=Acidithiobacillus sp. TaxID=1872118 RepID=UPI0025B93DCC|nr:NAD-dependent epimerase/dehydratase family protein [Acidithiobacillus sp.]MCK9189901.1 NAD(P)H-binding protein [Acidithiobacillus sp.]